MSKVLFLIWRFNDDWPPIEGVKCKEYKIESNVTSEVSKVSSKFIAIKLSEDETDDNVFDTIISFIQSYDESYDKTILCHNKPRIMVEKAKDRGYHFFGGGTTEHKRIYRIISGVSLNKEEFVEDRLKEEIFKDIWNHYNANFRTVKEIKVKLYETWSPLLLDIYGIINNGESTKEDYSRSSRRIAEKRADKFWQTWREIRDILKSSSFFSDDELESVIFPGKIQNFKSINAKPLKEEYTTYIRNLFNNGIEEEFIVWFNKVNGILNKKLLQLDKN
ncbi:MAG TPA: hypothetical protein VFF33_13540 [Ignavibacteriaceae bacterium]|nr:hypothetical protein [Ignavibacteriaceae bacterium]